MIKAKPNRSLKVASDVKKVLSVILLNDDDLKSVTITNVDVSPNLRFSKVFFVCYDRNVDDVMMIFDVRLKILQKKLAEAINLKYATTLQFQHDKTFENAERIEKILDEISKETKNI